MKVLGSPIPVAVLMIAVVIGVSIVGIGLVAAQGNPVARPTSENNPSVVPGAQPFQQELRIDNAGGQGTVSTNSFTVPNASRLVIDFVSAVGTSIDTNAAEGYFQVGTTVNGSAAHYSLLGISAAVAGSAPYALVGSLHHRFYADSGTTVTVTFVNTASRSNGISTNVTISGYLIPAP
jgi:hypothetical protein